MSIDSDMSCAIRTTEAVKYIKARIKDKSVPVAVISLHLLDQCMQVRAHTALSAT